MKLRRLSQRPLRPGLQAVWARHRPEIGADRGGEDRLPGAGVEAAGRDVAPGPQPGRRDAGSGERFVPEDPAPRLTCLPAAGS